jgi:hypothetical protein
LTKNLTRRRIYICSVSKAAIATLAKTTTGIKEYRAMRKQTGWLRKGRLKSHQISLLLYLSVSVKTSSRSNWNRGTGTGGLPVLGIGNPKC